MTILTKALSSIGLMRVSEHEAFVQTSGQALKNSEVDLKKAEKHFRMALDERESARAQRGEAWATIKTQADEIERLTDKFKKAVTDLADARCSLEDERATFNQRLADAVQDYQADAQKWRNSLKRSRDRKAGKKGVGRG